MDRKKKLENALGSLFGRTSPKTDLEKMEGKSGDPISAQEAGKTPGPNQGVEAQATTENRVDGMGDKKAKQIQPSQNSTKGKEGVVQREKNKEATDEYQKPSQSPTPEPVQAVPEGEDLNPQNSSIQDTDSEKMELAGQASALMVKDEILEDERQYLVFVLDNTLYGVDVSFVQTTIKPQPIYLVPGTVEFIKGLINLRGSVVPVVDLRSRFGLNQKELDKKTRFIVVEVGNIMASLIVDAVQGVQTIKENLIEQPSTIVMDTNTKFLQGVARFNNQLILMLNLDLTIRSELVKG